jgi:peptide/nickel transport system substrate-binding protein
LGLVGQPASLNPITDNNPALAEITPLLFESLLQVNPDTAQLQPGLARRWEYSNNGKQVTFYLPSNLKWSNGAPLTAAGLANSLKATAHPALLAFSRINAPNAQTLRLTFAKIDCAALTTLATLPLLPADQVAEPMPTGSGPFSIVDWSENKRTLTLSRNPHYRGPAPWLDSLTIRFIQPDQITLVLSESKFDLVGPLESSTINLQPANQQILSYPAPHLIHLAINYSPRNNLPLPPKVQQALRLAIDREAILNEALGGQGQLLAGSLLPGHWAANAALTWPAHNPERASKLLAQAGLRDSDGDGWLDQAGQRLELSIRANGENPLYQNLGWLISSYYRDLGLFARAEGVSFDNLLDDLFTQDFTLALFSWPLQADPDQRQFWQSNQADEGIGLNFSSYKNSKLDNLLDQAVATPGCSLPARAKIYAEIQQILADERPADFLLVPNRHLLVTPRLSGLKPGPFVPFTWNVAEWYNEPE